MNMAVKVEGNLADVRNRLCSLQIGQIVDYVPEAEAISVPLPKFWIIRRTAPNREFKIVRRAAQLGLSCYCPTITARREFRRLKAGYEWIERRNSVSPLITGAILIPDFDIDAKAWKSVDGVMGILRFGDFVPTLTPKLLSDIRRIEAIGNTPKSKRERDFEVGQLVRVLSGPFKDYSGRVERFDGTGRISIGIEIFSRISPATLDQGDIEAV